MFVYFGTNEFFNKKSVITYMLGGQVMTSVQETITIYVVNVYKIFEKKYCPGPLSHWAL